MAAKFRDSDARVALSHMAAGWQRLAERNDFIPPLATEAVVQQQQQIQPKKDAQSKKVETRGHSR
jgi:hypothetical protein